VGSAAFSPDGTRDPRMAKSTWQQQLAAIAAA
jgi:hypothetical protein